MSIWSSSEGMSFLFEAIEGFDSEALTTKGSQQKVSVQLGLYMITIHSQ